MNQPLSERFTDRVQRILELANREARRLNHEYIGTEHILLGLVLEGTGVAAYVLTTLKLDLLTIEREVERLVRKGPPVCSFGNLPRTPAAEKVIEYALVEARSLNSNRVGSEHILLGLLREHDGIAAQVLINLGLTVERARTEIRKLLGKPKHESDKEHGLQHGQASGLNPALVTAVGPMWQPLYERFTDRARKVVQLAGQEAKRLNHEYIATEHILLGLVLEGHSAAAIVLTRLNVNLFKVRQEVEKLVHSDPPICSISKLRQTPKTKRAIEHAMDAARNLKHNYIGTEHMLLGLLREKESGAAKVLINLGVSLEQVRMEIREVLGLPEQESSDE